MTKDTKYLDDNNKDDDSILTEDMLKRFDESYERVKKRLANPNYKPSRAVQRMHTIWQMESDYFNEQRQKQGKDKQFCFNNQIWHNRSSICDKRVLSYFLLAKSLGRVQGDFMGYKIIIKHIYNTY